MSTKQFEYKTIQTWYVGPEVMNQVQRQKDFFFKNNHLSYIGKKVNILNLQLLQLNEKIITLMRKGTNSQEEKHKWKYTHAKTHTSVKKKLRKSQECLFKQV